MNLGKKFTIMIVLVVFVVSGLVTAASVLISGKYMERGLGIQVGGIALSIANGIDADMYLRILECGDMEDPEYKELQRTLNRTMEELNLKFLYSFLDSGDEITYVIASTGFGSTASKAEYGQELHDCISSGTYQYGKIYKSERYGRLITAIAPIKHRSGKVVGYIGCDIAAETVAEFEVAFLKIVLISVVVIAILASIVSVLYTRRIIVRPLGWIQKTLDKIAHYNLDTSDERTHLRGYLDSKDEIGAIARHAGLMVSNLKAIMEKITDHAGNTAATAEELTATAQSTSDSTKEVASAVASIAEGATNQAGMTRQAAQAVEENARSLQDTSVILEDLKSATVDIGNKKNEGKEALEGLASLTEKSKTEAGFVSETIMETNASAERISKASEMIQSIADQTNLLALNAAIEAARAGDAGRGFAVVADEIRKLAEDSTKFTDEIRKIIGDLKSKAESAVDRMMDVGKIVQAQDDQTVLTLQKFDEIENAVGKSRNIVDRIGESARSIEEKNKQITQVIESLSAIAEENAAATQEASAGMENQTGSIGDISGASENLAKIATELQSEVARFNF